MRNKWTYEMLKEEALKYDSKMGFKKGNKSAYESCQKRGFLSDLCSHMESQHIKWTNEMLREEALKYDSKRSFRKNNNSAYTISQNRGILNEICSHMINLYDKQNRLIYIIEFENNSVYIGLTNDLKRRISEHLRDSSNKFINKLINNNIKFTFNCDNIQHSEVDATKIECLLIKEYKEKGYDVLNISKGGSLGYTINKWSNKMLKMEALKYDTRNDFVIGSNGAYYAAIRRGILDDICNHMIYKHVKWSDEMLRKEALKYNTRGSFQKGSKAYQAALRRGLLDDICSHMIKK